MAIFDQLNSLHASADRVAEVIKANTTPAEQFHTIRPNSVLIVFREQLGYVYLLRPSEDGSTRIRLLVDEADTVKNAFRSQQPKEALVSLVGSRVEINPIRQKTVTEGATRHLAALKQQAERSASTPQLTDHPNTNQPTDPPRNPHGMLAWLVTFTPAALIALGINWRRLGKPQWVVPTLVLAVVLPLLAFSATIAIATSTTLYKYANWLLPLALISINYAPAYSVWWVQRGGYQTWAKTGSMEAVRAHRYNWMVPILVGVVATTVVGIIGRDALAGHLFGKTVDLGDMTMTYPVAWTAQNLEVAPGCDARCLLAVTDSSGSQITVRPVAATRLWTPQSTEQKMLQAYQAIYPGLKLENVDTVTVSGSQAARHFYSLDGAYVMQIYFLIGRHPYELTAKSPNKATFDQSRANIDQVVMGIAFKS